MPISTTAAATRATTARGQHDYHGYHHVYYDGAYSITKNSDGSIYFYLLLMLLQLLPKPLWGFSAGHSEKSVFPSDQVDPQGQGQLSPTAASRFFAL